MLVTGVLQGLHEKERITYAAQYRRHDIVAISSQQTGQPRPFQLWFADLTRDLAERIEWEPSAAWLHVACSYLGIINGMTGASRMH